MLNNPKITVLMPVYNCEQYVGDAVQSILNQTYTDFEFLIIDDASTDTTVSVIKQFNDNRIKLIEKPKNTGYTNSLNYGISIAKGDYIARMDGDDMSLPTRFNEQYNFMEANKDIAVCGTYYSIIGTNDIVEKPIEDAEIKIRLLYKNALGHPTTFLRTSVLINNDLKYDPNIESAEDYGLWVAILAYGKLHNLPKVLLDYRVHQSQVSQVRANLKPKIRSTIRFNMLKYLDLEFSKEDEVLLKKIFARKQVLSIQEIDDFYVLKSKMQKGNANGFFEKEKFNDYLNHVIKLVYKDYFLSRKDYNLNTYKFYKKIKKENIFKLTPKLEMKLLVKSILKYKLK